jgi:hypothetical protein
MGTPPPTRPVLPPWGTTGTPSSAQTRMTSATSAVLPGSTTSGVLPRQRPVKSTQYPAVTEGSVATRVI